ncbi:hypothetical protein ZWY2020_059805 [Hordeum vulgare]|nr:hypothetical protein ZWY2020_059805 [Hordeum vulgare]
MTVSMFGDWDMQNGAIPDYSMDFSKIWEMYKQNKKELSRASLIGDDDLLAHHKRRIFRITPENSLEEHVTEQLNRGVIPDDIDVHCLASLIKGRVKKSKAEKDPNKLPSAFFIFMLVPRLSVVVHGSIRFVFCGVLWRRIPIEDLVFVSQDTFMKDYMEKHPNAKKVFVVSALVPPRSISRCSLESVPLWMAVLVNYVSLIDFALDYNCPSCHRQFLPADSG